MDWLYPKRRGPEWKQGWKGQTLTSISAPPLPLLAIFAIVIFFLTLTQFTNHKAKVQTASTHLQLFLFLLPLLLIFILLPGLTGGFFRFRVSGFNHDLDRQGGASPWGVAVLVLVLLVLVFYQSSFHSKWFGP